MEISPADQLEALKLGAAQIINEEELLAKLKDFFARGPSVLERARSQLTGGMSALRAQRSGTTTAA